MSMPAISFRAWLLSVILMFGASAAFAGEEVEILLKGHDDPLIGHLRQISHARYLLQGPNFYYEFPGNQIVTVNGGTDVPESARGSGRLIFSSFYEKVLPDGDVEIWSHNQITNDGIEVLTGTDWGAAAREADALKTLEVYDTFGNRLPVTITPKDDGTFLVGVDFIVPVAPKESLGLALKIVRKGAAQRSNGAWQYTFNVDFAEDRYLTRKIELPAGTSIEYLFDGCRKLVIGGRTFLLCQRYYPAGTADPQTVRYHVP